MSAAAQRPVQRSASSSPTSQSRNDTELLHQIEQRRDAPVLGDLAVDDPHGVDGVETDIRIGSSVGEGVLVPGLVAHSATKGAAKMFTQGLSREVASRGITVNNVQPGPIDTDLNPAAGYWAAPQKAATAVDRYGHVDEVAALVAFVAGPESSYITGANLTVDAG